MIHYMNLNPSPFEQIACRKKIYELRLNDEKRQLLQQGDHIVFTNTADPALKLEVIVLKLHHFDSFADLYRKLPLDQCGYLPEELNTASPEDMSVYYSVEKQKKYGVLGIEIQLIH